MAATDLMRSPCLTRSFAMPICTLILAAFVAAEPEPLKPGEHTRSVEMGQRTRNYLVHVPQGYDAKKAVPVVLAFHGGGSNPQQMVKFCGLNDKADKEGFLVVYPSGSGRLASVLTWNAGNCCGYAPE
jgi:polyhydroxybutyrate depolymerase